PRRSTIGAFSQATSKSAQRAWPQARPCSTTTRRTLAPARRRKTGWSERSTRTPLPLKWPRATSTQAVRSRKASSRERRFGRHRAERRTRPDPPQGRALSAAIDAHSLAGVRVALRALTAPKANEGQPPRARHRVRGTFAGAGASGLARSETQ